MAKCLLALRQEIHSVYNVFNSIYLFLFFVFLEIGLGWMPAIMNSEEERDFIKESHRLLSDVRTYWIGGSVPSSVPLNFSTYVPRPPEAGQSVEFL